MDMTPEDFEAQHDAALCKVDDAAAQFRAAEDALWDAVRAAREDCVSWTYIGYALGVSKQAAEQRFNKPPRGRLV